MKCIKAVILVTAIFGVNSIFDKCSQDPETQKEAKILKELENYLKESKLPNYLYYNDYPFKIDQFMVFNAVEMEDTNSNVTHDVNIPRILCDSTNRPNRDELIPNCEWSNSMLDFDHYEWDFLNSNYLAHLVREKDWTKFESDHELLTGFQNIKMLYSDYKTFWRIGGCAVKSDTDLTKDYTSVVSILFMGFDMDYARKDDVERCNTKADWCSNPNAKGAFVYEKPISVLFLSVIEGVNVVDMLYAIDLEEPTVLVENDTTIDLWQLWVPILVYFIFVTGIALYFCRHLIREKIVGLIDD